MEPDMSLMVDFFKNAPRQGPGSKEDTLRALEMIGKIPENARIVDIGCGSGTQTIDLAKMLKSPIQAIDLYPEFLDILDEKCRELNLENQISTKKQSMFELDFENESLDLIWIEGAIYIYGFEKAFKDWKKFLRPGGYLVASEISWTTNERPRELQEYWEGEYDGIDTVANKITQIEKLGYVPQAHFILPEKCWVDNFYTPLFENNESFLEKHRNSADAQNIIQMNEEEYEFYKKYKDYYSYVFYIAKKI